MSTDPLDAQSYDVMYYLERISDPEKARPSKQMDKDYVTHCLSAPNHTALYKKFNHKFQVINLDRRYSSWTDGEDGQIHSGELWSPTR